MWLFVLCRKRFTDSENQQVVKRLIAEVNTLDSKNSPHSSQRY